MKIGIDARVLTLPELRGIGTYLEQILKFWPETNDKFIFFTNGNPELGRSRLPNLNSEWRVVDDPKGSLFHVYDWLALPRAIANTHIDLFWSPANLSLPLINIPQVVTIHDTLLQEKVIFPTAIERFYFKTLQPYITRKFVNKVITVSEFSASRIHSVFNYPKAKISVILNGIKGNDPIFSSVFEAKKYLASKNFPQNNFIFSLGAESPWKNTIGLIKAFTIVVKRHPEIKLIISGIQERSMDYFKKKLLQLGLNTDQVLLLGFTDRKQRDAFYISCRCFVYPSLFEGFGLPPLEAIQLKAPVIASNVASIPEVVGNGALLADTSDKQCLADAINHVIENTEFAEELISRGESVLTKYQWDNSSTRTYQVITEVNQQYYR